jgi:transcription antitermination factor NusG
LFSPDMESWLALQVAPQHEKKVATVLEFKGFEQFYPTYKSKRRWSDRIKVILQPLFPGYVFCRSRQSGAGAILATPGVNRIVSFGGKPCPVPDQEIATLQKVVSAGVDPRPFPYLTTGQRVRIIQEGVLFGIVGILTQIKNSVRLVVSVDMITKSMSIEVNQHDVVPETMSTGIAAQSIGVDYLQRRLGA